MRTHWAQIDRAWKNDMGSNRPRSATQVLQCSMPPPGRWWAKDGTVGSISRRATLHGMRATTPPSQSPDAPCKNTNLSCISVPKSSQITASSLRPPLVEHFSIPCRLSGMHAMIIQFETCHSTSGPIVWMHLLPLSLYLTQAYVTPQTKSLIKEVHSGGPETTHYQALET